MTKAKPTTLSCSLHSTIEVCGLVVERASTRNQSGGAWRHIESVIVGFRGYHRGAKRQKHTGPDNDAGRKIAHLKSRLRPDIEPDRTVWRIQRNSRDELLTNAEFYGTQISSMPAVCAMTNARVAKATDAGKMGRIGTDLQRSCG